MSTTTPMPLPNDKSAPRWDGDYRTLPQFLIDYKRVTDAAGYTQYQAIKAFINYIPEYLRGDVQNYEEFNPLRDPKQPDVDPAGNWDEFKTRLYKDFPRALTSEGYTRPEFWESAAKNFNRSLRMESELETFARELRKHTTLLICDGNLSAGDTGSVFEEILYNNHGESFRAELHRQMDRKHTYTIDEIFEVAKEYVKYDKKRCFFSPELASLVANRGDSPATVSHVGGAQAAGYPSELTAALARLPPERSASAMTMQASYSPAPAQQPDVMQQILQSLQTLTAGQQTGGSMPQATQQWGNRSGPRTNAGWDQNGDIRCFYCGGPHIQPNCEVLKSDMVRGRCIRNQNGYVVFPNGDHIIQTPEMTNAQRVDHFNKVYPEYEQHAKGPATVKTMLVGVSETTREPLFEVPTFESRDAEEAWHEVMKRQVFAYEQKRHEVEGTPHREGLRSRSKSSKRKEPAPVEQQKPQTLQKGSEGEPNKHKRFEAAKSVEDSAAAAKRAFPSATIEEVPDEGDTKSSSLPAHQTRPQFRIQSSLEQDGLGKLIGERILETDVVLTVGELLAACPSVRRYWKDSTTAKRVGVHLVGDAEEHGVGPVASAQVFRYRVLEDDDASRDQIAAARLLPLRYLDCRIGNVVAEGIVDGGAQIVIVSKRLWTTLGKPIDHTHIMKLEAANNTNLFTLGVLANLDVEIGRIRLFLQAHVVEDAPFDLLLGRPFFAIGATIEETLVGGGSYITIHDPNSDRAVKLPTKERVVEAAPLATAQGF